VRTVAAVWITLLLLVAAFWLGGSYIDERTHLSFFHSRGAISSGERLGVQIGQRWSDADAALRRIFTPHYVSWETQSGDALPEADVPALAGRVRVAYRDNSWRNGMVVLQLEDGLVTDVSWSYRPLYFGP
jgi:hypothetical protein